MDYDDPQYIGQYNLQSSTNHHLSPYPPKKTQMFHDESPYRLMKFTPHESPIINSRVARILCSRMDKTLLSAALFSMGHQIWGKIWENTQDGAQL